MVGIPEKKKKRIRGWSQKYKFTNKKYFSLLVTSYSPNMQHIVNSLVNGGREPSDEPRDVSNVLQTETAGKWGYFL